jgi:hypothetical protein
MVSRRDGSAARSTGISCAKGNDKASSSTTLHSAGTICSIAQLRCPSAQLIGFEFGREVSGPLSYNTVAVPAAPETEDAPARAIVEPRGLPHCEAAPREGADSNGNSYYGLTEQGLAQTMGSGAAGCQERQAHPGIALSFRQCGVPTSPNKPFRAWALTNVAALIASGCDLREHQSMNVGRAFRGRPSLQRLQDVIDIGCAFTKSTIGV